MHARSVMALALVISAAACMDDLTPPSQVEDMRVLALRAEPPELLYDAPADAQVSFAALVVDPRGGLLETTWSFCPVESADTCLDYDAWRDEADPRHQAALDAAREQTLATEVAPTKVVTGAVPEYDVPSFSPTVSAGVVLYHIEDSALGFGVGAWPTAVLEVRAGDEVLRSQKRVVLNARDPRNFASVYEEMLGVLVCPETGEPPAGCLPLRQRTANSNPSLAGVEVALGERADLEFEAVVEPLAVAAGESIRLRPVLAADAEESFQRIDADFTEGTLFVEEVSEQVSVSWFCSAGELGDDVTWPQYTRTLDTTFTAPKSPPEATDGRVTVWMVARDGRGGVGWQRLDIEITP